MPKEKINKRTGRPPGTSKYKEETIPIRVPLTLVPHVQLLLDNYITDGFKAKFFSPIEDIRNQRLHPGYYIVVKEST